MDNEILNLKKTIFQLLNYASIYVLVLDGEMIVKFANQSLAKDLGFNKYSDVINKCWLDFIAKVGFPAACVVLLGLYIKQERALEQAKRDEFVATLLADRNRDTAKRDEYTMHLLNVIKDQQRVMDQTASASAAVTAAVSKIVERLDRTADVCPYRTAQREHGHAD
jgi:hypothetical protein